eukprot:gb/GFBE01033524.1/.p1 GENE.gb/GFBE01033524.1/~~gb/GFBE01033524.1/.p1  ORF type:complete len:270 (+),score=67.36 gb/GFBE01033524.1/:1-810(+)
MAVSLRLLALLAAGSLACATKVKNVVLRSSVRARAAGAEHQLRVCNAYPYEAALDILLGGQKVTSDTPLPYKRCADYRPQLKVGDRLEFKIGEANTGTFSVSDLPSTDAMLLLVIYRHDAESTTVSFESHVFEKNEENPQVAIIDTYTGSSDFKPQISDKNHSEPLRFGRVIAIKPGAYNVRLVSDADEVQATAGVVAKKGQNYVVLRAGVEAEDGPSFPEELVAYPSDPEDKESMLPLPIEKSSSPCQGGAVASALLAVGAAVAGLAA